MTDNNAKEMRARLAARGVESLDDAELLSIVLGDDAASTDCSASRLAENLLSEQSLAELSLKNITQLRQTASMGIKRAARAAAAFELGRRVRSAESVELTFIHDRNDIVALFEPLLGALDHEEMWVVYLTSANRIIERRKVAHGGSTALATDCKLILKRAVELVASSMIVVHNHPSGSVAPSNEDTVFTQRLKEAAELFDMTLLDHVIICRDANYSFRASKNAF